MHMTTKLTPVSILDQPLVRHIGKHPNRTVGRSAIRHQNLYGTKLSRHSTV
jgi:hypothetical protein